MGNSDNVIGYIEYLSDDGKIVGYVTPFTDVDRFKKEILEAAEVGMPITPVVFPDKLDKSLGLPRDIYWPGGFRKEKRQTYPYEIYQTNNRDFVFRNYAYAKTRIKAADYKLVYSGQMERWDEPEDIYIAHNQSNRPNAQKMRSVSISDIIVIHNRREAQAFYVDEYGYRQVDYLWWSIDSSDSAYWAVQENINAIRAAVGLSPLAMDGGLSAAADARCESFVAGGAFDHSGMTTRSEICAAGPIGSASSVCSYWQNSPAHYANITNASFTSMGVGCWFCSTAEGQYTYWTVTFN